MEHDPKQIEQAFAEALAFAPGPDRDAFLTRACGADAALRREVEALLAAHWQGGGILDGALTVKVEPGSAPASGGEDATRVVNPASVPPAHSTEKAGDRFGPYKLLEQIGEGGMGAVWMAEQTEPIRRRVALKVIKQGLDTGQVMARFEAERQALALMDHPNIAKVLDAGTTPEGRPYFVMELVKGIQMIKFCDEQRLSIRQRLELFMPICQAIRFEPRTGPGGGPEIRHEQGPLKLTQRFEIYMVDAYSECEQRLWLAHEQRHVGDYEALKPQLKKKVLAQRDIVSIYLDRTWFGRDMFQFLQTKTQQVVWNIFIELTTAASARRDSRREVRQQCGAGHRQPTSGAGTARPTRGRPSR